MALTYIDHRISNNKNHRVDKSDQHFVARNAAAPFLASWNSKSGPIGGIGEVYMTRKYLN